MNNLAESHASQLDRIKKNIENCYQGFKPNYDNFTKFQRFTFITAMDADAEAANDVVNRPNLEADSLESFVSRFCAEFAKNEPGIMISASDDFEARNPEAQVDHGSFIQVLEGHLRHILHESSKFGTAYHTFKDAISGGFSSMKVLTDYADHRSFKQVIKLKKTFDPIMVGFDNLAVEPDKSDGEYCFEIFPMRKEDFERQFKNVSVSNIRYAKSLGNFQWSYMLGKEEIILVADYYEKKKKKTKLLELADGRILLQKEYDEFIEKWDLNFNIGMPPVIVRERETEDVTIVRYQLIEDQVISHKPTNYPSLPIKFIDGNSVVKKDDLGGNCSQFTRPFIYQAVGTQILKNFAMQCLADELQKMRPAQVVAALEGIPDDYLDGYREPKALAALIYHAFWKGDPNIPLPMPQFAPRPPIPAEIMNTLMSADMLIQNILGSNDSGMSNIATREGSGAAIKEYQSYTNNMIIPYIQNFMLGFESCAQMMVDMMPLYYDTKRTIPILTAEGKRMAIKINDPDNPNSIMMRYQPGDFKVKIEASVNFTQQQQQAIEQITGLMRAVPTIGQFVSDTSIDLMFDNINCRDSETWRGRAEIWMQAQQEAKNAAMQQAMQQPNLEQQALQIAAQKTQTDATVAMAKVEQQSMSEKAKTALKVAELELDREKLRIEIAKIMSEMHIEEQKLGIEQQRADDERIDKVIDAAIKQSGHTHDLTSKDFDRALKIQDEERQYEQTKFDRELADREIKQESGEVTKGDEL